MKILVGKHSGFCFGVQRAVRMAEEASEHGTVYTYGKIIHNDEVVEDLRKKGVYPADSLEALRERDTLIIRAHGAPPQVYHECEKKGIRVLDATCPFVMRTHRIAEEAAKHNEFFYIAGRPDHPEIIGIIGCAGEKAFVLENAEQAAMVPESMTAVLTSQTTLKQDVFKKIREALKTRIADLSVYDTICDTTRLRQEEAEALSKVCTRMFVLGSLGSANTKALHDLCKEHCKNAEIIDKIDKIPLEKCKHDDIIGIVAGASTPIATIREVYSRMSELEKTIETIEAEAPAEVVVETTEPVAEETVAETVAVEAEKAVCEACEAVEEKAEEVVEAVEEAAETVQEKAEESADNFEQAFEKTVKRIRPGQFITGTVLQVVDGEVFVNIGYKSDGIVPKTEFSADPELRPEDVVKEGDSIDVEVLKVNDGEGNVLLSRKNVEGKKVWDELLSPESVGQVYDAVGKEVVKGGLVTDIKGVRAFVPASLVSTKYVEKLDEYVGKTFKVKILEVDRQRKRMVASAKQVLLDEAAAAKQAKWDALVVGEKVHGVVRRITDFGAFVDIGGIDGLVHVTDCAWGRVKQPSDALSIGQEIEVLILNVDKEKERVSLGYKQLQPKPWTKAAEKYPIGSIVEGKVVRIVPFGAFVALEPTIDGLIHISQVAVKRVEKVEDELKVGDIVRCKVLEVNVEAKRISLSRKEAILEENPEVAEQLAAEKAERERLYQERKAAREQANKERQERQERRAHESAQSNASATANPERQTSRPDRRRRSEDGEYELPPVQQTTTSLADLFANFKPENEE